MANMKIPNMIEGIFVHSGVFMGPLLPHPDGSFHNLRVLIVGVLVIRDLLFRL